MCQHQSLELNLPDGINLAVDANEEDFLDDEPEVESEDNDNDLSTEAGGLTEIPSVPSLQGRNDDDEEVQFNQARQAGMWVTPDQLGQMVEKLVDQKLKQRQNDTPEKSDRQNMVQTTPVRSGMPVTNQVKSPSDTTLYRPALTKRQTLPVQTGNESNLMISKIADFVDAIRVQQDYGTGAGSDRINIDNSAGDNNRAAGEEDIQLNRSLHDEDQEVIEAQEAWRLKSTKQH